MMKGNLGVFAVGNGHFVFLLKCKEDKDIVFQNGPYFLDQGECIRTPSPWNSIQTRIFIPSSLSGSNFLTFPYGPIGSMNVCRALEMV